MRSRVIVAVVAVMLGVLGGVLIPEPAAARQGETCMHATCSVFGGCFQFWGRNCDLTLGCEVTFCS
jgi:hypothetical protein